MTGETETRDRALGEMLERIAVPRLSPTVLEQLARASGASTPATTRHWRPRPSRLTLVAFASFATVGIALAIGLSLSSPNSPTTTSKSGSTPSVNALGGAATDVRTLLAFNRVLNARSGNSVPPGVARMLEQVGSRLGEHPTSIAEPIVGPPSIYLVTFKPNRLCVVFSSTGVVWGCGVSLRQAGGSLLVQEAGFDNRRFVYGIAANDVTSITVASKEPPGTPGTSPEHARLANNAFVAPLPYQGGFGLGAVTVTATRTDGSTGIVNLPATKGPPGLPGAMINPATGIPRAADASKKHALITSGNVTLWTAPRSDGNGYCVWFWIPPSGGGGSQCNLPIPAERELGLGISEGTVLEGRVGSNVARVQIQFANRTNTTLTPTDGWVLLAGISQSAEPLTATAYNTTGNAVATQTLGDHARP